MTKLKIQKLYYIFLRTTVNYNYYKYYFESCQTITELNQESSKLWAEYLQEFHFFSFYPKDCLMLAYQDKVKKLI